MIQCSIKENVEINYIKWCLFVELKWEYRKGFYFAQTQDCQWVEFRNGLLAAYYKLVEVVDEKQAGKSVVLYNNKAKKFVQIYEDQLFEGSMKNEINSLIYLGKWIKQKDAETADAKEEIDYFWTDFNRKPK